MSISDLSVLLSDLKPELIPGNYVFCFTKNSIPTGISPLGTFKEPEGLTVICRKEEADVAGLSYSLVMRLITLKVHSSLSAVGMTAAITKILTEADISANVVAAYHHDHIFVPSERAEEALHLLTKVT
ncbi:ACT domain-containing protein [Kangiella sediminilitoris]|uniref:Acetyltransferase n=1 Tax=Kangiella sediminilitoris TaxID=1144748 RepID=A0A1B3BAY7_9GAMM|nr:ACT domain-containing protein [Kangiella sediminilitoris]AOE49947.1 acetyltransferase [Kangiella sediminilitoris]